MTGKYEPLTHLRSAAPHPRPGSRSAAAPTVPLRGSRLAALVAASADHLGGFGLNEILHARSDAGYLVGLVGRLQLSNVVIGQLQLDRGDGVVEVVVLSGCLLYTSPSPRDRS